MFETSISGWGRPPERGNGTPAFLPGGSHGQRSLWTTVIHGVMMSQTWLSTNAFFIRRWNCKDQTSLKTLLLSIRNKKIKTTMYIFQGFSEFLEYCILALFFPGRSTCVYSMGLGCLVLYRLGKLLHPSIPPFLNAYVKWEKWSLLSDKNFWWWLRTGCDAHKIKHWLGVDCFFYYCMPPESVC